MTPPAFRKLNISRTKQTIHNHKYSHSPTPECSHCSLHCPQNAPQLLTKAPPKEELQVHADTTAFVSPSPPLHPRLHMTMTWKYITIPSLLLGELIPQHHYGNTIDEVQHFKKADSLPPSQGQLKMDNKCWLCCCYPDHQKVNTGK